MGVRMLTITAILASTFGSVGLITGIYWLLVAVRMRRLDRFSPQMADGLHLPAAPGRVSVVVPAHNEERVIERLVTSVLGQQDVEVELVVVLDRCTDRTLARLRDAAGDDPRVRIVEVDHCPDDWAGKCHAAAAGAAVSTGDWILFTDADVGFDPGVLRASTALAADQKVDLLTAWASLTARRWWEIIAQPPAAITLLRMFPPDRVNNFDHPRSFANGQFMLFRRDAYTRIGGHDAVKAAVLEDLAFAALVHRHDGRVLVSVACSMVQTDMYDSLDGLLGGWKRILVEAAKRNIPRLVTNLILVLGSGLAPIACWVAVIAGVVALTSEGLLGLGLVAISAGLFGLGSQGLMLARIFGRARMPRIGVLGWTVGCLLVCRAILEGIGDLRHGRPIRWGGREYVLRPGPR
ncbi:MAG: hypothetical protein CMJ51_04825 [Planctomycetaceae bacterium]|nr:hypothetical protein [Planctomycetaceae bacterium]